MKKITLCLMLIFALIIVPGAIFATDGEAVAKIGETYYTSLQSAIDSIKDNTQTTITLVRSVEDGTGFKIPSGRNITIDFGGYTYNISQYPVGSSNTKTNGCQLLKDSNITFKNGTLTATCVAKDDYKSVKILIQNYSNLTLENMNIDATSSEIQYGVSINNGEVEIKGETDVTTNDGIPAVGLSWWPTSYPNGAQVTIDTTGTITGDIAFNGYYYEGHGEVKSNLTIEDVNHVGKVVFNTEEVKELVEEEILVTGGTFSSDVTEYEPVAKIGDKTYTTLEKALADVPTDGAQTTITLLKNVENGTGIKTVAGQNVVIDFAGYTYDASAPLVGSKGTVTNACQLLKGSTVTFKNGTLTSTKAKILIQNYSDLTVENMNLDATKSDVMNYAMSNNYGEVNVTGNTSITIAEGKTALEVCWWPIDAYKDGVQVKVNTTGTITGNIEFGAYNYDPTAEVKSNLTIENINHKGQVVFTNEEVKDLVKSEIEITGGTFSSDVKEYISSELNTWENQDGTVEVVKERKIEMYVVAINGDVQFGEGAYSRDGLVVGRVGEKVYLSVTQDEGYEVVLTIKDAEGKDIAYGEDYSFVMPDSDVSIKAEFTKKVVTPPAEDEDNTGDGTVTPPAGDEGTTGEGGTGKEELESEPTVDSDIPDVPKTGDNIILYVALAGVALMGILKVKKINVKTRKH